MKKKLKHAIAFALLVGFAVLALGSMGSSPSSSSSSSGGDSSGGSSGSSGYSNVKSYTVVNRSSYDVTMSTSEGSVTIAKGGTSFVRMDINRTYYQPDDKVAVGVSGDMIIFTNK